MATGTGVRWGIVPTRAVIGRVIGLCGVFAIVATAAVFAAGQAPAGQAPPPAGGRGAPAGPPPSPPPSVDQVGHGTGKLVVWGDLLDFSRPGTPLRCYATNRFKRGQKAGFRLTAIDGGTGEPEFSAELVVHLTYAGKTLDIPARWRGLGNYPTAEYVRRPIEQWTAAWVVPEDAQIGTFEYTVTAKDKFGRTTTFTPFPNHLTYFSIVE